MKRIVFVVLIGAVAVCGAAGAENLVGADTFLCAGLQAIHCDTSGVCDIGMPWDWNMPEFIEFDLVGRTMSTTAAADRQRQTSIRTLERSGGEIFLQGVENARAFSFVIDEATGVASVAIAADGHTFSVFAACTPLTNRD